MGVVAGLLVTGMVLPFVGGTAFAVRNMAVGFLDLPSELDAPPPPQRSVIHAADGSELAQIYDKNRQPVRIGAIAPVMRDAIMASEDRRFYEHNGVDFQGTFRAVLATLRGETQGGSSLTQQYVKNVLLEGAGTEEEKQDATEVTIARKVKELRYAIGIEKRMAKDEILAGYLNVAYFGDGAYGIESAARHYFGVAAADLELGQASMLAALVRSPSGYNPLLHPEKAIDRRNIVLDRMVVSDMLGKREAAAAQDADLVLDVNNFENGCMYSDAPFFCTYVVNEIERNPRYGKTKEQRARWLRTAGLRIRTTLVPRAQEAAQDAVDRYVPRRNESGKVAAQALVEPGTGAVRAIAQSRDFGYDENVRGQTAINFAVDAEYGGGTGFQAGSTFKAFTLAAALDQGMGYGTTFSSPGSTTVSGLRTCGGDRLSPWDVKNSAESDSGRLDMIEGTKGSVNTYFAQLQAAVGLCDTVKTAKRLGVHRADGAPLGQWASFTLGDQEVSPLTMAGAYAVFASGGTYCRPEPIASIDIESTGERMDIQPECREVLSEEVANGVSHVLAQTFDGGTADGLGIGRPAAAKSGTTDGAAYSWFAGYTPHLSSAVAVGDPRGGESHPLRHVSLGGRYFRIVYGADIPGPIWRATMSEASAGLPASDFTDGVHNGGAGDDRKNGPAGRRGDGAAIPDVLGRPKDDAVRALKDAGYTVRVSPRTVRSPGGAGTVAAVNPNPGSTLPKGSVVRVFVGRP
ncbi:membrane peptidoglycan carboxypeptidase [Murinocardiopsis flavida]|uniref:Membrane peptidoglycan carboxypeptidase n=2 Tax=Murinocardiopsis flavida TaxID=645275 RepID=A0A2P8CZ51_9ACTN|nr:membrane peptidoglycan carboxypeptidase [Murinocardiopsis flavida]